jgi:hypothetical protein
MPGKPVPPLPPVWNTWLACPVGRSPVSLLRKPRISTTFAAWGGNALLCCLVAALFAALRAIALGDRTVLWWLLGAHLPFAVEGYRAISRSRRYDVPMRIRRAERTHILPFPLRLFIFPERKSRVSETGIFLTDRRFLGWDRIASFRYHGERDSCFALQLRPHTGRQEAQSRPRYRLRQGALLVPSAITLLSLLVGALSFGWRSDVIVALLLSTMHLFVLSVGAWLALRMRTMPEAEPFFLVFDSREVSAQEVLRRFWRHLPWEDEPE